MEYEVKLKVTQRKKSIKALKMKKFFLSSVITLVLSVYHLLY